MHETGDDRAVPKKRKMKVLKPDAAVNAAWCKIERPEDTNPPGVSKEKEKRLMELRKNWIKELTSSEKREEAEAELEQVEPKGRASGTVSPGNEIDERLKRECERIISEIHERIDAHASSMKEMTERYIFKILETLHNDGSEADSEKDNKD